MGHTAGLLAVLACVVPITTGCPCCEPDPPSPPVADGACADTTGNRFVDCGNGTVTDTQTQLIWMKNASCFPADTWPAAVALVAGIMNGGCQGTLSDHSSAGDWRLPTPAEWQALAKPSCSPNPGGPAIPDQSGNGCYFDGTRWAIGVESVAYWSSADGGDSLTAYAVNLGDGLVAATVVTDPLHVWTVRN
jgi:hypothetical protein